MTNEDDSVAKHVGAPVDIGPPEHRLKAVVVDFTEYLGHAVERPNLVPFRHIVRHYDSSPYRHTIVDRCSARRKLTGPAYLDVDAPTSSMFSDARQSELTSPSQVRVERHGRHRVNCY